MKILHTSDWHLGINVGPFSMEEEQKHFFEQLYKIIEDKKVDAVICAGDVYDSSVSNADAIKLYDEVATNICIKQGVKMIVIAGNHDGAERISSCNRLLKEAGLYVSGRLDKDIEPVSIGNADIYCIPFFNKDEVRTFFPDIADSIKDSQDAMLTVCDKIRANMNKDRRNIVVSHAHISGAELSESDRSAVVGTAFAISKDVFKDFDYVALGHIHKPQNVPNGDENSHIRYSGTPIKYSFGVEEKQVKSVTIIDTEDMSREIVPVSSLHDRKSFRGTYDEIMQQKDELKADYLKLEVTDRICSRNLTDEMRNYFPFLCEIKGKDEDDTDSGNTNISMDEYKGLTPEELVKKYISDNYGENPNDNHMKLFTTAFTELLEKGEI